MVAVSVTTVLLEVEVDRTITGSSPPDTGQEGFSTLLFLYPWECVNLIPEATCYPKPCSGFCCCSLEKIQAKNKAMEIWGCLT